MGLSTTHISPRPGGRARRYQQLDQAADTDRPQPIVTLAVDGGVLRVEGAKRPGARRGGGPRGAIVTFSRAARNRMLELFGRLKRSAAGRLPLMVTLTYPKVWNENPATWKRDLDTWFKRLKRRFPACAGVWRLEFQRRGAPHFHVILFGAIWLDRAWVSQTWADVVASGDLLHLKAGTRVERVRSWKGVMSYAAKYLGKKGEPGEQSACGRYWGVFNRGLLPIELLRIPLTFGQFFRLRRFMCAYHKGASKTRRHKEKSTRLAWRPKIGDEWRGLKLFLPYQVALQLLAACQ